MNKTKLAFIAIILLATNTASAYEFTYKGTTLNIDDNLKSKIDILVERKMSLPTVKSRYFNALKKYDISKFSETKKGILNYLLLKLDPAKKNLPIVKIDNLAIPTISEANQLPISTPIAFIETPANIGPRIISNTYSSDTEKTYVETLRKNVREYIELNDNFEFNEYSKTFRVNVKEYYSIDFANPIKAYLNVPTLGKELLYKKGGQYFLTSGGYTFEQKQTITDIISKAKFSGISDEAVVFKSKGGYYYAYTLYDFKYYTIPNTGIYMSQYSQINSLSDVLLIKKGGEYLIVAKYGEYRLFPTTYLQRIKNPLDILSAIGRDLYFYKGTDYETTMLSIKNETEEVTKTLKTDEEKAKALYSWITKNLKYDEYSKQFVQGKIDEKNYLAGVDNNVFTGLGSFKSKNSVCDGYTKLLLYMLAFAGVDNISVETGKADVGGGQIISHAWNRIGDKLYDATWDTYAYGDSTKFKWFALTEQELYKTHFKEN